MLIPIVRRKDWRVAAAQAVATTNTGRDGQVIPYQRTVSHQTPHAEPSEHCAAARRLPAATRRRAEKLPPPSPAKRRRAPATRGPESRPIIGVVRTWRAAERGERVFIRPPCPAGAHVKPMSARTPAAVVTAQMHQTTPHESRGCNAAGSTAIAADLVGAHRRPGESVNARSARARQGLRATWGSRVAGDHDETRRRRRARRETRAHGRPREVVACRCR